jgi:hypothetical protein
MLSEIERQEFVSHWGRLFPAVLRAWDAARDPALALRLLLGNLATFQDCEGNAGRILETLQGFRSPGNVPTKIAKRVVL